MDKTTRIMREITDEETEKRHVRTSRLRQARLEREASTPNTSNEVEKEPRIKAVRQA